MASWDECVVFANGTECNKLLEGTDMPYGNEATNDLPATSIFPLFEGRHYSAKLPVCCFTAGVIFLTTATCAILVGLARLVLSPAAVTSWMGQHVQYALNGMTSVEDSGGSLASGYEMASDNVAVQWLAILSFFTQLDSMILPWACARSFLLAAVENVQNFGIIAENLRQVASCNHDRSTRRCGKPVSELET
ncbi:hypothetical protein B0J13DRAFT_530658 [Dactylonectria estremocensis]|uniref:Uncharacterized protein n=1 Tax=Dactylonectria estremocensis TaxID=1079267 RepID=A0A9P9DYW9_9HYPO|nr:hypothetical protein B0J13DRAFT_530658 [Dactylonectria estremocensis]